MATSKVIDAERLRNQQLHVQYSRFMRKQQLEYGEAISSLKKQQLNIEGRAQEKIRLQQLNLQLTGELEDYRTQTKRLLVDLQSKDADILQLRQQLSRNTGSEVSHFSSAYRTYRMAPIMLLRLCILLKMSRYYNTTMRHYWDMLVK